MILQGYDLGAYLMPWAGFDIGFMLVRYSETGQRENAVAIEWAPLSEGASTAPSFTLPPERAQRLMDMLWDAGMRPTQGKQSEGVTAAQARHLDDMRTICFSKLNIAAPNAR
jgi:hypothetical protein